MASAIGRESELGAVERLISRALSGFAGLVLEGEAGIEDELAELMKHALKQQRRVAARGR